MTGTYPYKKTCLYCNEEYTGRLNSKFCHPTHKALYHAGISRQKVEVESEKYKRFKKIIDMLIKNCEILDGVVQENPLEQVSISREQLMHLGFNFEYHTSIDSIEGYNVFMCFDKGLKIMGIDNYEVIAKR